MQRRVRISASREGERFGRGRCGLPRVLTALLLFVAMLAGVAGTAREAPCATRKAVAAGAAHLQPGNATDLHRASPDQQGPSHDGRLPSPTQCCTSAIALPVFAIFPTAVAAAQAPLLERPAALVAMHQPPTLFRPPRVI
jgi:hypothetical protein